MWFSETRTFSSLSFVLLRPSVARASLISHERKSSLWSYGKNTLGFYKTLNPIRRFFFNCRHHPRFWIEKAPHSLLVSRHFLAPVTTKKRAKTSASARRRRRRRRRRFSLSWVFSFWSERERERERERNIHTHTRRRRELFSFQKCSLFFALSLKGHTHFYSHLSLKSRRRRRSSFRENRLLSVANTDTQRESEWECVYARRRRRRLIYNIHII